jgi:hypothetical protein
MLIMFIVAAEIGFWMILLAGLFTRYVAGRKRLGLLLLALTPVVDLALLVATTIDLRHGAEARFSHALAAVYIGVSVAWGAKIVRWADTQFAYRFAGAPRRERPARAGREHAARERREWLRHLLAWATGSALLGLGVLVVGDADRTRALISVAELWTLVLVIDFVISFSYTLSPRRPVSTGRR